MGYTDHYLSTGAGLLDQQQQCVPPIVLALCSFATVKVSVYGYILLGIGAGENDVAYI